MQFDIIPITGTEAGKLSSAQMGLLRNAQQKKNELLHSGEKELKRFELSVLSSGMKHSSLTEAKRLEIESETEYRCAVIADELLYDMSVINQVQDNVSGNLPGESGSGVGYTVNYSLSYSQRYVIVRDYYLQIKDVTERMTKYAADETAKKYLDSYYKTLYNVLATYEK